MQGPRQACAGGKGVERGGCEKNEVDVTQCQTLRFTNRQTKGEKRPTLGYSNNNEPLAPRVGDAHGIRHSHQIYWFSEGLSVGGLLSGGRTWVILEVDGGWAHTEKGQEGSENHGHKLRIIFVVNFVAKNIPNSKIVGRFKICSLYIKGYIKAEGFKREGEGSGGRLCVKKAPLRIVFTNQNYLQPKHDFTLCTTNGIPIGSFDTSPEKGDPELFCGVNISSVIGRTKKDPEYNWKPCEGWNKSPQNQSGLLWAPNIQLEDSTPFLFGIPIESMETILWWLQHQPELRSFASVKRQARVPSHMGHGDHGQKETADLRPSLQSLWHQAWWTLGGRN